VREERKLGAMDLEAEPYEAPPQFRQAPNFLPGLVRQKWDMPLGEGLKNHMRSIMEKNDGKHAPDWIKSCSKQGLCETYHISAAWCREGGHRE
jgi:hypothetical protein